MITKEDVKNARTAAKNAKSFEEYVQKMCELEEIIIKERDQNILMNLKL
jgi:hypothetical protein